MPTVTVCLPVFNAGRYLREAIDGILAQTFADWQLIVSDNASTDDTNSIVDSYRDPRISYFRHEVNIGGGPNFQSVMDRVTTPLFCFHAGDDYLFPEHLERRVRSLAAHPDAAYAHGAVRWIDEHGHPLGDYPEPLRACEPRTITAALFLERNIVNVASTVIRTEALRKLGFALDLRYGLLFDWHLFMTLALNASCTLYDDMPTATYRRHPRSVAWQTSATACWEIEAYRLRLESLHEHRAAWSAVLDPDLAARSVTRRLWRRAIRWMLRGDPATASKLARMFLTRGV
jgi:glycosyltransferase involved in cell wall biosynthesis